VDSSPSKINILYESTLALSTETMIFKHSSASSNPITPGAIPTTPASPQLLTLPPFGHSG